MGRLGFEPRTSRLKAECSTTELATPIFMPLLVRGVLCATAKLAVGNSYAFHGY